MTIISTTSNGGGAAINLTHSGPIGEQPKFGESYGDWLLRSGQAKPSLDSYRRPLSNTERTRRQLAKAERAQRVAARLLAEEEARQTTIKAHQAEVNGGHKKGSSSEVKYRKP